MNMKEKGNEIKDPSVNGKTVHLILHVYVN